MDVAHKIALGCGKKPQEGFVGLDVVDFGWNKIWDATKNQQIPFPDTSATLIEAHNFFEHIERKHWIFIFNECWRVLKPNGILEIIVPDAGKSIDLAMADITHVSLMVKGTITKYLTCERPRNAGYGLKPWIVIRCENPLDEPRVIFAQLRPNK
jgi:SAM-dependent methyltransferase